MYNVIILRKKQQKTPKKHSLGEPHSMCVRGSIPLECIFSNNIKKCPVSDREIIANYCRRANDHDQCSTCT